MKASTAKSARSTASISAMVTPAGFSARRNSVASAARSRCAAAGRLTTASTPAAWCICWAAPCSAGLGWPSPPRVVARASASRSTRRRALCTDSSVRRSSSWTQAKGLRSAGNSDSRVRSMLALVLSFMSTRCGSLSLFYRAGQSADAGQVTLNRATDCFSASADRDSSCTIWAVERVPSEVCSVTAKMCWMLAPTSLAARASFCATVEI